MNPEIALAVGAGLAHGALALLLLRVALRFFDPGPRARERILRLALLLPIVMGARAWVGATPPSERLDAFENETITRLSEQVIPATGENTTTLRTVVAETGQATFLEEAVHRQVRVRLGWPPMVGSALSWLGGLWLAGALLRIGWTGRSWWRLHRRLAHASPAPEGWQAEARTEADAHGLREPRVLVAEGMSPFAAPGRTLVLPPWFGRLEAPERRAILAHEMAHIARRDPERRLATELLRGLLWPLPGAGWAVRELRNAVEYRCDDWAIQRSGDGFVLARALAEVAERIGASTDPGPAEAYAAETGIADRIERALDGPAPDPRFAAGLLAVVLVVGTFVAPPLRPGGDLRIDVDETYDVRPVDPLRLIGAEWTGVHAAPPPGLQGRAVFVVRNEVRVDD